jgi:acylphosphatase
MSANDGRKQTSDSRAADLRRVYLCFVGQVQGVGFRWTALHVATTLNLTGWVRNMRDGSVQMELQGTDDQIARFFGKFANQYARYPIHYVIDEKRDVPLVPAEERFTVRSTA